MKGRTALSQLSFATKRAHVLSIKDKLLMNSAAFPKARGFSSGSALHIGKDVRHI